MVIGKQYISVCDNLVCAEKAYLLHTVACYCSVLPVVTKKPTESYNNGYHTTANQYISPYLCTGLLLYGTHTPSYQGKVRVISTTAATRSHISTNFSNREFPENSLNI